MFHQYKPCPGFIRVSKDWKLLTICNWIAKTLIKLILKPMYLILAETAADPGSVEYRLFYFEPNFFPMPLISV